jgi:hypothetical protein
MPSFHVSSAISIIKRKAIEQYRMTTILLPKIFLNTLKTFQRRIAIINITTKNKAVNVTTTPKVRAFSMLLVPPKAGFGLSDSGNIVQVSKTPYVTG